MMNAAGLYPTQPATPPLDQFGPQDPNQQQVKRGAMVRKPLGDLAALADSTSPMKVAGQQPEPGPADTDDAAGQMPTTAKAVSSATKPQTQPVQQAAAFGPPSPSPAASPAPAPIQQATPGSAQLQQAQQASGKVSQFGPEPTWNTLPDEQKHHGIRKVLDYIAAAATGIGTLNPMAGMGLYHELSRAPLREAQSTWEANTGAAEGEYKRNTELAKQGTSEEKAAAQEAAYQSRLTTDQRRLEEEQNHNKDLEEKNSMLGKKVVRKYQDAQGNWKAEQADGSIVDTTPEQTAGEKSEETYNERVREADRQGLTGEDRKMFIANGKLSDPAMHVHIPSEASEAYNDWKASFKRDNGREPTAEEINNYRRGGAGRPPHAKDRETFESHWGKRFADGEKTKEAKRKQVMAKWGVRSQADADQLNKNSQRFKDDLDSVEAEWNTQKQELQNEKDAESEQYGIYNQQPGSQQGSQPGTQRKALPSQQQTQPSQPTQPQPKVATRAHVQAYAKQLGISEQEAEQRAIQDGYSIQ